MTHTVTVHVTVDTTTPEEATALVANQLQWAGRLVTEYNIEDVVCDDCIEIRKRGPNYKHCLCDKHAGESD